MPETFAITTTTTAVPLDAARRAAAGFTVSNTSGRALRGRAQIVPAQPAAAPWLTLDGAAERDYPPAGTQQYTVQVAVPPGVPGGDYAFRLDLTALDDPAASAEGPSVTFTVPDPGPPPPPFPWWIVIAAGVVLLLIVGIVVFLVVQDNNSKAAAAARFDGEWRIGSGSLRLAHNGGSVQGVYTDTLDDQVGTVQGTVGGNTLSGQWMLPSAAGGPLALTLDALGASVAGTHPFCGARAGSPFPPGCSFAGEWTSMLNNVSCPMTLSVVDFRVGGPVCGFSDAGGSLALLHPGGVRVTGSTGNAQNQVEYTLFLNGDATQFQGTAIITSIFPLGSTTTTAPWCGARANHPLPVPCQRTQ